MTNNIIELAGRTLTTRDSWHNETISIVIEQVIFADVAFLFFGKNETNGHTSSIAVNAKFMRDLMNHGEAVFKYNDRDSLTYTIAE